MHAVHSPWSRNERQQQKRKRLHQQQNDDNNACATVRLDPLINKQQWGHNDNTTTITICSSSIQSFSKRGGRDCNEMMVESHIASTNTATKNEAAVTVHNHDDASSRREIEEWFRLVSQIIVQVEEQISKISEGITTAESGTRSNNQDNPQENNTVVIPSAIAVGYDRLGKKAISYAESLPFFIQCAANGNLQEMKTYINEKITSTVDSSRCHATTLILQCLNTTDRNGSTAEEWAAGKGHLECLEYLLNLREQSTSGQNSTSSCSSSSKQQQGSNLNRNDHGQVVVTHDDSQKQQPNLKGKKRKKREQKTPLHWAARHGHVECVNLLISRTSSLTTVNVDATAGDGTTPLHFACYGGHLSTVQRLIECGADPTKCNDWGCDCSHWVAMSSCNDTDRVIQVCNYLYRSCNLDFFKPQKQGQTPLHKAAQKKNIHVIQWLQSLNLTNERIVELGRPDKCGNKPSEILIAVGGDGSFANQMKKTYNW